MQKCSKICENMQKCKNNMQIFKFIKADNRFQRSLILIKLICYFMPYMQICKNPKSIDDVHIIRCTVRTCLHWLVSKWKGK